MGMFIGSGKTADAQVIMKAQKQFLKIPSLTISWEMDEIHLVQQRVILIFL